MRERKVSLGHTDGQVLVPLSFVRLDLFLRFGGERDSVGSVHLLRDDLDLLLDREFEVVQELERVRRRAGLDDGFTEIDRSFSSFGPVVARNGSIGSGGEGLLFDESDFGRSIGTAGVEIVRSVKGMRRR